MSEVLTYYENAAIKKANIERIKLMISQNYSQEQIFALNFTEEEYQTAVAELCNCD